MSGSKKKYKKSPPREVVPPAVLSVEVLQFGSPQASGHYLPRAMFHKRVTFGSSRFASLPIPFSKLPGRISMFEIRGRKVFVVLDPRIEGFVNRGGEFGDVREFLSPRGAIAEIATIDDPLHLEIQPGSRGSLRIYGFEIIFKYEKPSLPKKTVSEKGEFRGVFAAPPVDDAIERRATWIAAGAVAAAMIPFTFWLLKAPVSRISSVSDLPQAVLGKIIHPMHLAILPRVFDDFEKQGKATFVAEEAVHQGAFWVAELQRRWNSAEHGQSYTSPLEIIRITPDWDHSSERMEAWRSLVDRKMALLEARRTAPDGERYYRFQAEYPRLVTLPAGEGQGSFRARLLRRLEGVRQANRSVRSLISVEQRFLQEYYKSIIAFKRQLGPDFWAPGDVVFGPKPHRSFYDEAQAYLDAGMVASSLSSWPHRWKENDAPPKPDEQGFHRALGISGVWLSRDGLVAPGTGNLAGVIAAEGNLVQNALFSIAAKPLPPPPPPRAHVDSRAVESVILSRREELKACFEAALRRNPKTAGTVKWKWIIDERGAVQDPQVVSESLGDRELLFCIKARLTSWKFPRPVNGSVSFEYPFQFSTRAR